MKKYLVACNLGGNVIRSYIVEMIDGYRPSSDNMLKLKKAVVKGHKPRSYHSYAAPPECGGYMGTTTGDEIKPENLPILAVSNLEL